MTKQKLGKGLDALLSKSSADFGINMPTAASKDLKLVSVNKIMPSPYQPRREFDEGKLEELSSSIKSHGLLQPVVIRIRPDGAYELIAGERRLRASALAGLDEIPAIVENVGDKDASTFALIENLQREDLNPLEEASGYHRLQEEFGLTQDDLAKLVGKSRSTVANSIRLLSLGARSKQLLQSGHLEMGHARALLALNGVEQDKIADLIANKKHSVRQAEKLIRGMTLGNRDQKKTGKQKTKDADLLILERELTDSIGAGVSIDQSSSTTGKLSIRYGSLEELDGLIERLRK
jgi:ParB family chromosome partitioning protein